MFSSEKHVLSLANSLLKVQAPSPVGNPAQCNNEKIKYTLKLQKHYY